MKTTKGNRLHIGFFGKRNVGKSSIVNKITGQDLSIVSNIKGTTTDVNEKAMELLPIGPVVLMDTAGFDDTGKIGSLRIEKTKKALERTDVAVLVLDDTAPTVDDLNFFKLLKEKQLPVLTIINKIDKGLLSESKIENIKNFSDVIIRLSAERDADISAKFKEALIKILPEDFIKQTSILGDIINKSETAVLVIPIDKEAPKGRLILPQVNTIRDLLDNNAISVIVKETELQNALDNMKTPPKIVITDSQAFGKVSKIVPENIKLTSFSILFARLKGDLKTFIKGANKFDSLNDNDTTFKY